MIKDLFGTQVYVNVINHKKIGDYLDYDNFKCRKNLFDKLAENCSENINGNEMPF